MLYLLYAMYKLRKTLVSETWLLRSEKTLKPPKVQNTIRIIKVAILVNLYVQNKAFDVTPDRKDIVFPKVLLLQFAMWNLRRNNVMKEENLWVFFTEKMQTLLAEFFFKHATYTVIFIIIWYFKVSKVKGWFTKIL